LEKPENISFEEASALSLAAITALHVCVTREISRRARGFDGRQ
jgi:NADPH:quinone reductase-like Zn-dependent oxidoreductase